MNNLKRHHTHGFTLVELLIATTVFSVVLLIITAGIISIGNSYYKGANQSRTQSVARNIIDEISRSIQFSGVEVSPTTSPVPDKFYFCASGTTYAYRLNSPLAAGGKALMAREDQGCSITDVDAIAPGRELLTTGMRLLALDVTKVAGVNKLYKITVTVAQANDSELLDGENCKGGAGQQFCAVSKLTTTVGQRIK